MQTTVFVQEWPPRIAHGGQANSYFAANIDADLAARPVGPTPPHVCLLNPTGNSACTETADPDTWKANFAYVLDAIHTAYGCDVWIARIWKSDPTSQACQDVINNTLVPAVMATRAWTHLGIDERLLLPGNDNGATYTLDGVHPNAAGNALIAAAWLQLLGY